MLDEDRFFLGLLWWLMAFGVIGYQCYEYLRTGVWLPISLNDGMIALGSSWAEAPVDWVGLHNVFDAIPLSVATFGASFFLLLVYRSIFD